MNNGHQNHKKRIVITGLGIICPAGAGKDAYWEVLSQGKSCVNVTTRYNIEHSRVKIAAEIPKKLSLPKYPRPKAPVMLDRASQYALIAAYLALEDARFFSTNSRNLDRIGTILGTSVGGIEDAGHWYNDLMRAYPNHKDVDQNPTLTERITFFPGNMVKNINVTYNFRGRSDIISTGCTASTDAIGIACKYIQNDYVDMMLAGGAEAPINLFTIKAFDAINALSTNNDNPRSASRPFDKKRDGFVMGEGSAIVVLEELEHAIKRGANIYCEVLGYQTTCDAYHETGSDPEFTQCARAIRQALQMAEVAPEEVGYVSAHGSSTPMNDKNETGSIKKVFGKHAYKLAISSIKSMVGHASGAAGAMQSICCSLIFKNNLLSPTINYEFPDPECDLDYVPNKARSWQGEVILQNTFGFSGKNSALVYKRFLNN